MCLGSQSQDALTHSAGLQCGDTAVNKTEERLCPSGANVLKGGEGQCPNERIMHQGIRRALKGNKALGDDIENETYGEKEGKEPYGEKEEQVLGGGNSRGCEEARGAAAGRARGSDPEPERHTSSRALLGTRPAGQSTRALTRATSTTGKRLPQTHVLSTRQGDLRVAHILQCGSNFRRGRGAYGPCPVQSLCSLCP